MKRSAFRDLASGLMFFYGDDSRDLKLGEKIVLVLILGLFDQMETVTKADVVKSNKAIENTSYSLIRGLEGKGYISSTRSNQFYSPSFIKLESKALIFASRLRRIVQAK